MRLVTGHPTQTITLQAVEALAEAGLETNTHQPHPAQRDKEIAVQITVRELRASTAREAGAVAKEVREKPQPIIRTAVMGLLLQFLARQLFTPLAEEEAEETMELAPVPVGVVARVVQEALEKTIT